MIGFVSIRSSANLGEHVTQHVDAVVSNALFSRRFQVNGNFWDDETFSPVQNGPDNPFRALVVRDGHLHPSCQRDDLGDDFDAVL